MEAKIGDFHMCLEMRSPTGKTGHSCLSVEGQPKRDGTVPGLAPVAQIQRVASSNPIL